MLFLYSQASKTFNIGEHKCFLLYGPISVTEVNNFFLASVPKVKAVHFFATTKTEAGIVQVDFSNSLTCTELSNWII